MLYLQFTTALRLFFMRDRNMGCLETGDVVSSNLCPNLNFRAPGFGNCISFMKFQDVWPSI